MLHHCGGVLFQLEAILELPLSVCKLSVLLVSHNSLYCIRVHTIAETPSTNRCMIAFMTSKDKTNH